MEYNNNHTIQPAFNIQYSASAEKHEEKIYIFTIQYINILYA